MATRSRKKAKKTQGRVEQLRKDLKVALASAQKQRKVLQQTLSRVLDSARETLSALGKTRDRIGKLLSSRSADASASARKAVREVKKAAKSARTQVRKAARTARSTARKAQTQARKQVKAAQRSVRKVQKRVSASLPDMPESVSRAMSRAAMATSKAKAAVIHPSEPAPAPMPTEGPPTAPPGGPGV